MPNWCTGSLKMRGKHDDILKFLTEGVGAYEGYYIGDTYMSKLLPKDNWLCRYDVLDEPGYERTEISYRQVKGNIYVKGTNRAFINYADSPDIIIDIPKEDRDVIAYCSVSQAWDFRPADWIKLSKQYNIDFRLYGIEQGGGFERYVETHNRELLLNLTNNFDNNYEKFQWECPFPWIGG